MSETICDIIHGYNSNGVLNSFIYIFFDVGLHYYYYYYYRKYKIENPKNINIFIKNKIKNLPNISLFEIIKNNNDYFIIFKSKNSKNNKKYNNSNKFIKISIKKMSTINKNLEESSFNNLKNIVLNK